jgi:hypothetical protein
VLILVDFLDHLMREHPSSVMQSIKRNFYPRDSVEIPLDEMICVRKGYYSAFRFGEVRIRANERLFRGPILIKTVDW